ncbi:Biosynthetic arginine decarboxylase [Aquicella siphonis]|uniref:Biosynthetic arginine decarboxylase n=1 Tax=Aquicella siphonis TaxID=254247 RepID=A0A5E4PKH8_9COXI|nr:biosynthetic arginine decarboxylase [Aquicella siphonis]VVC77055.1 Biosynthetic arginine decarboxylase [Aquicella siphonis]
MTEWSIQQARELYHVAHWSDGFFDISEHGTLRVQPNGLNDQTSIDLNELAQTINASGISFPILLRFTDILRKRIQVLNEAFVNAIKSHDYQGKYLSAYPIKVNQQRHVVESILQNGKAPVGLETGSKPELLAALAMPCEHMPVIICNGYKDREYIRLALIGQRLGHQVYIILEKFSELGLALEEADKLNIEPCLGVRVRLTSVGAGKWQESGGEKSKFGFSAPQLLQVVETLRAKNRLNSLRVLHFFMGSQLANIADIQRGMHEGVRYYETLRKLGAPIDTIDVGGGLGIDYEGTRSRSFCSMNYSIQEYANNVVYTISDMCNQHDLPHPQIVTESGRAITAHHAMIITNIIASEPPCEAANLSSPEEDQASILHDLWESYINLSEKTALESYHDACHWMSEVHTMYIHGLMDLKERAYAEQIYYAIFSRLRGVLKPSIRAHREIIDELNEKLAHKFVCNFSLFQSLPDAWAINQVFPIIPLSGLDQQPTLRGILHDITCDSDGRIDTYVNNYGLESTLPLMPHDPAKPYLLGIFLVGAYQEILGDMHNLFGDTHSIHLELQSDGSYQLTNAMDGDTVESSLRYVDFNGDDLLQSYQRQLQAAKLTPAECEEFLSDLSTGLKGYTYFEE